MEGIVFLDVDGTLVDERIKLFLPTEKTVYAVKELQKKGYGVVIATGRARNYVPKMNVDFDGYVTSNGACAELNGKTVADIKMDKGLLIRLMKAMDELDMCYALENIDKNYTNGLNNDKFIKYLTNFNIPIENFFPLEKMKEPRANKLIISYNSVEDAEKLQEIFKDEVVIGKHRSGLSSDLDAIGMSKAEGIKAICRCLDVGRENTYAFGDGFNDYTMIKYVGHGVAMKRHAHVLDDICEFVTESVEDEGIYCGLKKLGLID